MENQLKTLPLETINKINFADGTYVQDLSMYFAQMSPTDTPENGGPLTSDATRMTIAFPKLTSGVLFEQAGKYLPFIVFYKWFYSDQAVYARTICDIRIETNAHQVKDHTAFRLLKQVYDVSGSYIQKSPIAVIAPKTLQVTAGDMFIVRGFIETNQGLSSNKAAYQVQYLVGLLPVE